MLADSTSRAALKELSAKLSLQKLPRGVRVIESLNGDPAKRRHSHGETPSRFKASRLAL
jgi:hypothetical protein